MPKIGRPRVGFDMKVLEGMATIMCTAEECASVLGVSLKTIERRLVEETGATFGEFFKKHADTGKRSLRRAQFELAMEGHATMLIWLGKQWLGQKDISRVEQTGADGGPIQLEESPRERIAGRLARLKVVGGTDADTA